MCCLNLSIIFIMFENKRIQKKFKLKEYQFHEIAVALLKRDRREMTE